MPAAVLKARTHRASAIRAMTVDAVVRDEQLRASRCRALVAFMRIPQVPSAGPSTGNLRPKFHRASRAAGYLHRRNIRQTEPASLTSQSAHSNQCMRSSHRSRQSAQLISGLRKLSFGPRVYRENTNRYPPQLVHRERSGSVVPRCLTSYGRFAATSPAISSPMSPPIPA